MQQRLATYQRWLAIHVAASEDDWFTIIVLLAIVASYNLLP